MDRIFLNYFEAVPMGFETQDRDYQEHQEQDFEAVPMGFETYTLIAEIVSLFEYLPKFYFYLT